MGVLSRFESRLGGVVEGGFSRVFRSRVEPIELAVALKKEADAHRAIGPQQTHVPNEYEVDLGPADYERLAPYRITLGEELAEMVREHASEQRYTFVGPVTVALVRAPDLRTGAFRVGSRVQESAPPPAASRPAVPEPPPTEFVPAPGATAVIPARLPPRAYGRLELPGGEHVTVGTAPVVLGRGQEADVRLADASVSRRHAEVRVDGARVLVEDLGSTNGTTVNGERVARAWLSDGDTLVLGAATIVYRA